MCATTSLLRAGDTLESGMREPLVTVCVPTIGRAEMLTQTLESLRHQTYTHLEILLLDNASPDESRQILQHFADEDPRARVMRSEQRLPMFQNFNRGVRAACGDYITFFFDDDVYLPEFIEQELRMLLAHPRAGFVGSNYFHINEAGRTTDLRRLVKKTEVVPGRDYIRGLVWRGRNIIGTPGIMYRRDIISTIPFDESLSVHFGDAVMLMRMAEVADVALIATPLLRIRLHPEAVSSSLRPSQAALLRTRMLNDYIAEYRQRWPDDRAFVASLQRAVVRSDRIGLMWGWIAAGDEAEAEKCLNGLRFTPAGRQLTTGLRFLDRVGFSAPRRHATLAPLLRRLGRVVPA
jgi:glycosyltransferase involved in cell wall biosynthesis